MKYLLDTNIIIFFFKKRFDIEEKISSVKMENCCISEITVAELLYGAYNSPNAQRHLKQVAEILDYLTIVPISDAIDAFAQQKATLRKKGTLIDDFDLLIGATALKHGFTLVTNNQKHFVRIEGLKMEDWVVR